MKEIFTELYKKVLGFFQTQEKETDGGSNKIATNRLKLVLMQDRTNLTPYLLERMRGEMIDILSKYVEMDKEALELNFEQEGDQMALMLSIPVIRAKEEEEINAIIKAEEEARAQAEQSAEEDKEEEETAENQEDASEKTESDEEDGEEEISSETSEEDEEEPFEEDENSETPYEKKSKKKKS